MNAEGERWDAFWSLLGFWIRCMEVNSLNRISLIWWANLTFHKQSSKWNVFSTSLWILGFEHPVFTEIEISLSQQIHWIDKSNQSYMTLVVLLSIYRWVILTVVWLNRFWSKFLGSLVQIFGYWEIGSVWLEKWEQPILEKQFHLVIK